MRIKEKFQDALAAIKEETQKQFERTKEAIENFEPNQLEKKIAGSEKEILKYEELLDELDAKKMEYQFKLSIAKQEKEFAEKKLKAYND